MIMIFDSEKKKKVKNVDFLKSKYYSPPYIYVYAQY